jgi:hypothetical protein
MIIKSDEAHVLTHLGMGDQITCNGLVRELYKKHSKLYIYCKLKYFYSIEFMYRDLPNLHVLPMEESGAHNFINCHGVKNFYNMGYDPKIHGNNGLTVEQTFFQQAGISFSKKWESFFVQRDPNRESLLFNHFKLTPGKYVFVHDDIFRRQIIDSSLFEDKQVPIFRALPEHTNNIFDFCKLIENAQEVHVIESCMMFLIDLVFQNEFKNKKLFIHRYTKPIKPFEYPTNILDWKIYA